jgi:hypothetical protein
MRARVSTRQVRAIVEHDPNDGIPIKRRVRCLEVRLDEIQERSEERLVKMSSRLDDLSGRSNSQFEELRSLMSQLLSRVGQSITIAEQAFHWRCSDCPQRPAPPIVPTPEATT